VIAAGKRLGSYEVLSPLGAGGMGEVYRARDERLGREVAIKVLPAEMASDRERLKRFEKEARSASSLNHPSIVTIYEIGQADSVSYIAMELVEGKTLRELVAGGPLPIKKLLQIGAQVAEGLSRAHEAGIVHRDLKPENVMVTKDGLAKILDFGLAKLTQPESGASEATHAPTVSGATEPGLVMGTVGYMSPEQTLGKSVDFRSDQFSFGSILYEMATGRRAFARGSAPQTMAAIIQDEPESIAALNAKVPAPVRWIVERCLAKETRNRYASTEDLAHEIRTLHEHLPELSLPGLAAPVERIGRPGTRSILALLALLFASGIFYLGRRTSAAPVPTFRRLSYRHGAVVHARFAPDGQTVVYSAEWEGRPLELFSTQLDAGGTTPLNLPGADIFSISSRGEMAVSLDGTLARVPLAGGGPRPMLEDVDSADWAPDGSSLAVAHRSGRGQRLEYPIGKILYETSGMLRYCRVSPGGDMVAFLDLPLLGIERGSVAVVNRTGQRTVLSADWSDLQTLAWSPDGAEVWFTGHKPGSTGGIWAVSLSGKVRLVSQEGGAIEDIDSRHRSLVTRNIPRGGISGLAPGERQERDLSWFDFSNARDLSADGRTLLFEETGDGAMSPYRDVYIRKMDGSPAVRLGEGEASSFSPDGKWVLSLVGSTPPRLELIPTGTGETSALARGPIIKYGWSGWFPDGKRVFFTGFEAEGKSRVYSQEVTGGPPHPLTPEGFSAQAAVSPDGGSLVVRGSDGKCWIFPTGGGEPRSISGIQPTDRPIRFGADGASLYVERDLRASAQIHRIDLRTGQWSLFKEVVAADPAGLDWIGGFRLTPDASAYVYSYSRAPSDLFVAEGLK
jgi:eukaryotic-like serine/threonine-protein kinase